MGTEDDRTRAGGTEEKEKRRSELTSGARYSGVPQKVFMVAASVMPSLHRPKSVIFMCPSLSSIRFSNWKEERSSKQFIPVRPGTQLQALFQVRDQI